METSIYKFRIIQVEEPSEKRLLNFSRLQAPMWALPIFAVAISFFLAIAVPLLLKPGSDAFNDQRNDIGVFSDKNHPWNK